MKTKKIDSSVKRVPRLLALFWLALVFFAGVMLAIGVCSVFDRHMGLFYLPDVISEFSEYSAEDGGLIRMWIVVIAAILYIVSLIKIFASLPFFVKRLRALKADSPTERIYTIDAGTTLTAIAKKAKRVLYLFFAHPCVLRLLCGATAEDGMLIVMGFLLVALALLDFLTAKYVEKDAKRTGLRAGGLFFSVLTAMVAICLFVGQELYTFLMNVIELNIVEELPPLTLEGIYPLVMTIGIGAISLMLALGFLSLMRAVFFAGKRLKKRGSSLWATTLVMILGLGGFAVYVAGLTEVLNIAGMLFPHMLMLVAAVLFRVFLGMLSTPPKKREHPWFAVHRHLAPTLD